MEKIYKCDKPLELAKKVLFRAYQASKVIGMGALRQKAGATIDEVFQNASTAGDYSHRFANKPNEIHADYVFGRCMKFMITILPDGIAYNDIKLNKEYQTWCEVYPTYQNLIETASLT